MCKRWRRGALQMFYRSVDHPRTKEHRQIKKTLLPHFSSFCLAFTIKQQRIQDLGLMLNVLCLWFRIANFLTWKARDSFDFIFIVCCLAFTVSSIQHFSIFTLSVTFTARYVMHLRNEASCPSTSIIFSREHSCSFIYLLQDCPTLFDATSANGNKFLSF